MHLSMKVCIFSTCIVDLLFPNVGQAMVEVLERFGCETVFPKGQVCCGQPTYNSGYSKETIKTFYNEIDALLSVDADYIVGPSGSCVGMLKEYKDILKDDPNYAKKAGHPAQPFISSYFVLLPSVTSTSWLLYSPLLPGVSIVSVTVSPAL